MDFPRAPRFHAYLTERLGISPMAGDVWSVQQPSSSSPVLIDESAMPFAGADGTICVVGEPSTSDYFIVRRYREDPDDPPHDRINVDTFKVWNASLPPRLEPNRIATAASTSYKGNCQAYVQECAFVERQPNGPDHWQPSLPRSVSMLLVPKSE